MDIQCGEKLLESLKQLRDRSLHFTHLLESREWLLEGKNEGRLCSSAGERVPAGLKLCNSNENGEN